jgi:hypothetical protein
LADFCRSLPRIGGRARSKLQTGLFTSRDHDPAGNLDAAERGSRALVAARQ